jgi:hypothetical protein
MNLSRTYYYSLLFICLISFIISLVNIKFVEKKKKRKINEGIELSTFENNSSFILPLIAIASFFVGCYFVSILITIGENKGEDKYSGIIYLFICTIILLIINATILNKESISEYVRGKKFNVIGLLLTIGISAIVFGFIDNFGMKLGTEGLDDTFVNAFITPFSYDDRFVKYSSDISKNIKTINKWTQNDWRKIINHTLRFENEISKNSKMKDLSNAIKTFNCKKLTIPKNILKSRDLTNEYVDNIREKFDLIDSSKAMMGNSFSNFLGALLGGGIINLFIYLSKYDDTYSGDDKLENNFIIKNLEIITPILEAIFIAIGCLIPVFLVIAMKSSKYNRNSHTAWIIIVIIIIISILMFYFATKGIKDFTKKEKINIINKNLDTMLDRINVSSQTNDKDIYEIIQKFKLQLGKLHSSEI